MLKNKIYSINQDFESYIDRETLFKNCINRKLKVTLQRYNEEIDFNSEYLLQRSSFKVLKALTKLQKKEDKKVLEENFEGENEDE